MAQNRNVRARARTGGGAPAPEMGEGRPCLLRAGAVAYVFSLKSIPRCVEKVDFLRIVVCTTLETNSQKTTFSNRFPERGLVSDSSAVVGPEPYPCCVWVRLGRLVAWLRPALVGLRPARDRGGGPSVMPLARPASPVLGEGGGGPGGPPRGVLLRARAALRLPPALPRGRRPRLRCLCGSSLALPLRLHGRRLPRRALRAPPGPLAPGRASGPSGPARLSSSLPGRPRPRSPLCRCARPRCAVSRALWGLPPAVIKRGRAPCGPRPLWLHDGGEHPARQGSGPPTGGAA